MKRSNTRRAVKFVIKERTDKALSFQRTQNTQPLIYSSTLYFLSVYYVEKNRVCDLTYTLKKFLICF